MTTNETLVALLVVAILIGCFVAWMLRPRNTKQPHPLVRNRRATCDMPVAETVAVAGLTATSILDDDDNYDD